MIDENLTWKTHLEDLESKIAKNVGVLFKASKLLNTKSLKSVYFSLIHSYISYANGMGQFLQNWSYKNLSYIKTSNKNSISQRSFDSFLSINEKPQSTECIPIKPISSNFLHVPN